MKVLLTNDDGFGAAGLEALISAFSLHHDVWVVAPDRDRSGVSHGFTMSEPLRLKKQANQQYTCSGIPADCTDVASKSLMGGIPDVVVSGINRGANLGTDILFSGTAAAARQASMHNIPGIAVSLASYAQTWNYEPLAQFVAQNIKALMLLCERDIFVNINAPDTYKSWKMTIPSRRSYQDFPEIYNAPDGTIYSFFGGGKVKTDRQAGTDFTAVDDGFLSISRILAQPCAVEPKRYLPETTFVI